MVVSFVLLCFVFKLYNRNLEKVMAAAVCTLTAYILIVTELLSVFHKLTTSSCWICYIVLDIVLMTFLLRERQGFYTDLRKLKVKIEMCYLPIAAISLITLFLALKTVPYNWDSMTYHLPRIMHWVQNRSVAHYATNSIRQIASPVLAEFVNMQIYMMYGGKDCLFNLLQWGAYVGNAILVIAITRKLHVSKNMAALAGFLFMTMPIAFGEALTTQNDQYVAFWLLLFVVTVIDFYDVDQMKFVGKQIGDVMILSACIAFGYLTKPSIFFAILFFALGLLICCIKRKDSIVCVIKMILVSVGSMVPLLVPEMVRNIISFHALSSSIAGARQIVGTHHPLYLFVNFLKNFCYNFPNHYFDVSEICDKVVYWTAYKLKIDINAESISEGAQKFELHPARTYQHDKALNPVIVLTSILLITVILLCIKRIKWEKDQKMYCVLTVMSFVTLCVFMRWEHFVTRYMLAYLALMCPMAGVLITLIRESSIRKCIWDGVIGILVFVSLSELMAMIVYHYQTARIENKSEAYFAARNWEYVDFQDAIDFINQRNYTSIGLVTGGDTYEYPIWGSIKNISRIEHLKIENESGVYYDMEFTPQCVWVWDRDVEDDFSINGVNYTEVLNNGRIRLLEVQE